MFSVNFFFILRSHKPTLTLLTNFPGGTLDPERERMKPLSLQENKAWEYEPWLEMSTVNQVPLSQSRQRHWTDDHDITHSVNFYYILKNIHIQLKLLKSGNKYSHNFFYNYTNLINLQNWSAFPGEMDSIMYVIKLILVIISSLTLFTSN